MVRTGQNQLLFDESSLRRRDRRDQRSLSLPLALARKARWIASLVENVAVRISSETTRSLFSSPDEKVHHHGAERCLLIVTRIKVHGDSAGMLSAPGEPGTESL